MGYQKAIEEGKDVRNGPFSQNYYSNMIGQLLHNYRSFVVVVVVVVLLFLENKNAMKGLL
jgi:hypothetical protein